MDFRPVRPDSGARNFFICVFASNAAAMLFVFAEVAASATDSPKFGKKKIEIFSAMRRHASPHLAAHGGNS